MMSSKQFGALLGFLFAVTVAAFGLGTAVVCLLVAFAFYAAAGLFEGSLGMGDAQERLAAARDGLRGSPAGAPPGVGQPAPATRTARVR